MTNGSSRISYEGSHEVVKERGFNLVHILQSILEFNNITLTVPDNIGTLYKVGIT